MTEEGEGVEQGRLVQRLIREKVEIDGRAMPQPHGDSGSAVQDEA
ncbi:MAG: hypothetical protein OEY28_12415 [Nitrospira sp.]|nr:hypothetical protein [Nitrospira sp.]